MITAIVPLAMHDGCHEFSTGKPRCALSFASDAHWLFEFVFVPPFVAGRELDQQEPVRIASAPS